MWLPIKKDILLHRPPATRRVFFLLRLHLCPQWREAELTRPRPAPGRRPMDARLAQSLSVLISPSALEPRWAGRPGSCLSPVAFVPCLSVPVNEQ